MSDSAKDQRKRPAADIPEPKGFKAKIRKLVRRAARPKQRQEPNVDSPAEAPPAQDSPNGVLGLIGRFFGMIDEFFDFLWNMMIIIFLISVILWVVKGCEGEPPLSPGPGTHNRRRPPRRAQIPALNPITLPLSPVARNITPAGR